MDFSGDFGLQHKNIHKAAPRYWRWWRGVVVNVFWLKRSYSTPGRVSTAMDDCLRVGTYSMVPTVRGSQGIQKYHGAKVNKDAEKKTELLHAHCIQQFKIFSARFARRLFILLLFHLFCRPRF